MKTFASVVILLLLASTALAQTAPDAAELTKLLNDFLAGASRNDPRTGNSDRPYLSHPDRPRPGLSRDADAVAVLGRVKTGHRTRNRALEGESCE